MEKFIHCIHTLNRNKGDWKYTLPGDTIYINLQRIEKIVPDSEQPEVFKLFLIGDTWQDGKAINKAELDKILDLTRTQHGEND